MQEQFEQVLRFLREQREEERQHASWRRSGPSHSRKKRRQRPHLAADADQIPVRRPLRDAGLLTYTIDDTRPGTFYRHFLSIDFTGLRCTAGLIKEKRLSGEAILLFRVINRNLTKVSHRGTRFPASAIKQ